MVERKSVADLRDFDGAPYLDSKEVIAAYLADVLDAQDDTMLASALGDIARLRGLTGIVKSACISRERVVEELRPDSVLRFNTVNRVRRFGRTADCATYSGLTKTLKQSRKVLVSTPSRTATERQIASFMTITIQK